MVLNYFYYSSQIYVLHIVIGQLNRVYSTVQRTKFNLKMFLMPICFMIYL